jgi:hypothetical protein
MTWARRALASCLLGCQLALGGWVACRGRQCGSVSGTGLRGARTAVAPLTKSSDGQVAAARPITGGDSTAQAMLRLERRLAWRSAAPPLGEPALRAALGRLWRLFAAWTADYMTAHRQASPAQLRAAFAASPHFTSDLDPPPVISVVPLEGAPAPAFAVAAGWGGWGTFFVLEQGAAGRFDAAWSIEPLALAGYPRRDELGYWAFLARGFHDGPLSGRLLALPAGRGGRPRFLVDAITSTEVGEDRPGQISVWEWSDHQAAPLFIKSYGTAGTTYDRTPVRRDGDRLLIGARADAKVLLTCDGNSDEPAALWTLRLAADRVLDQGLSWQDPAAHLVDELLDRVQRSRDAAGLAAPAAFARLHDHKLESACTSWTLTRRGSRQILRLLVNDGEWFLTFTLEPRAGGGYVTAVEWLPGPAGFPPLPSP